MREDTVTIGKRYHKALYDCSRSLAVLVLSPESLAWLAVNDPKGLAQAQEALADLKKAALGGLAG